MSTKKAVRWSVGILLPSSLILRFEVHAQEDLQRKVSEARLDFAVPDAPAFKILNTEPSVVLRPSDPREVALSIAGFAQNGGVLPKTFSAEFSPAMLIGGPSLTLQKYRDSPFLYRARISAASSRLDDGNGSTFASVGLRFTIIDDADPRLDEAYLGSLSRLAQRINRPLAAALQTAPPMSSGPIPDSVVTKALASSESLSVDQLEQSVASVRAQQKEKSWYKQLVEAGMAARYLSSDSLVSRAKVDKYAGWFVAAFPVSDWGQFLVGGSGAVERSISGKLDSNVVSLSARFYVGSNDLKAYVETQIDANDNSPARSSLAAGGEMKVKFGLWLEFVATLQKTGQLTSNIATSLKVHWSLPEMIPTL